MKKNDQSGTEATFCVRDGSGENNMISMPSL